MLYMSREQKLAHLARTSYRDFLLKNAKLGEEAVKYFQGRSLDFFALDGLVRVEKADGTASADDLFELHRATSIYGLKCSPTLGQQREQCQPNVYH